MKIKVIHIGIIRYGSVMSIIILSMTEIGLEASKYKSKHGEWLKKYSTSSRFPQQLSVQNSLYPEAREDKQWRPVEDSKSGTSGGTDPQKKVGLDWPHLQEGCQQHHQANSDPESTEEEKERKTQEHTAQGHLDKSDHKILCRKLMKIAPGQMCW